MGCSLFMRWGFPALDRQGNQYFPGYKGGLCLLDRKDRDDTEIKFELVL